MKNIIFKFDAFAIDFLRKVSLPMARLALFTVFFWFGALKLFGTSPANPLVEKLLEHTLPSVTFAQFILFFGLFEMLIGITFLIPRLERFAIAFLIPHMFTTLLSLIFLKSVTWQGFLAPTLEGQYIIKNLVIIALAIGIAANLRPLETTAQKGGRRSLPEN
ncbi:MAG: hypothetical protein HYZ69_01930 [Candidatus Colwellbacteria bacterium]|nr:hypothetical protein [Candidatus Colwellbacteria bacterium]